MSAPEQALNVGERVAVKRLEGWIPKSPFEAVVERVTKDAKGRDAYVLLCGDQYYGLTQRAPASFLLKEMVIHELRTPEDLMDPCSGLGFVQVDRR